MPNIWWQNRRMASGSDLVRDCLRRWGEDLVDLSRRNRLLYFKHLKTGTLEFEQTAPTVLAGLRRPGRSPGWRIHIPPEPDHLDLGSAALTQPPKPTELVIAESMGKNGRQIARSMRTLESKSRTEFLDTGLHMLHLGLGFLHWRDPDSQDSERDHLVRSPLYLLPVELRHDRAQGSWRLVESDRSEAEINPTLAVALDKHYEVTLPALDDLKADDYASVAAAVRRAVHRSGWTVDDSVALATFTFHKDAMYRDLRDNEDIIAGHPTIRLLAEGPASAQAAVVDFEVEQEDGLDDRHPPEDLACVLDADATQRRCLIHARQGSSFVMDGPPGTGKSQTITNVIAQLLSDGKTVLFVSEKAAALEVVHNRLAEAGLDPFVLSLHSHKTTRKAFHQELGKALRERPQATSRFTPADRADIERRRKQLTDYAIAVNEVRQPLQRSLHDVVGEVSQVAKHPCIPLPELDFTKLDPSRYQHIIDHSGQLARSWGPVERGDDFLWRDLAKDRLSGSDQTDHRHRVERLSQALSGLQHACEAVQEDLHIAGQLSMERVEWLHELLSLIENQHPVSLAWLTTPDLEEANPKVEALIAEAERLSETVHELDRWSTQWRDLDAAAADRIEQYRADLNKFLPSGLLNEHSSDQLRVLESELASAVESMRAAEWHCRPLADAFRVDDGLSVDTMGKLAALGALAQSETLPETAWFHDADLEAARAAQQALAEAVDRWRALRDDLSEDFKPEVVELDLDGLRARFAERHKGLRKLARAYRVDKATFAAVTVGGRVTRQTLERLNHLVAWQEADRQLAAAEAAHKKSLGTYYPGRDDADFERSRCAIEVAERAIDLAADVVGRDALMAVLARDAKQPSAAMATSATETSAQLAKLYNCDYLTSIAAPVMPALARMTVQSAVEWCTNVISVVGALADEVAAVAQPAGGTVSVSVAARWLRKRAEQALCEAQVATAAESIRHIVGDQLAAAPDAQRLRTASEWVRRLRGHLDTGEGPNAEDGPGPINHTTASLMMKSTGTENDLAAPRERFQQTLTDLLEVFKPDHARTLRNDLSHAFEDAVGLLDELQNSVSDIRVWSDFVEARRSLEQAGLGPVIEVFEQERRRAADIGPTVRHSILRRWADQVIDSDARLSPGGSDDRCLIRDRFQDLDRKLVDNASAAVMYACGQRRPMSLAGDAAHINKEAEKKKRHLPVRRLLERAGATAQLLKPCFMMSPLSVSKFLPPGLHFDAVIFDEASQVREADAANCIYRGDHLIVAGDQKQLPPTSFFDRMADTDDEDIDESDIDLDGFESILDRCKAQGFPSLPLEWHYRSRHESLITYSNHSFYEGKLHTFPGAVFESPDLGVELFRVEGVYRRGTTRDNREEAAEVVDRVLFHRRHHPDATMGVVALSTAQQKAIENEIERRWGSEAELRELDSDDRLDGFFVKNLESVQGDERDIIIITIGYGPDENGKLTMNFGPLNREGGQRRLNVAITRARRRVEVVTTISAGDIVSDNPSINHLRRYLDYAERGHPALAVDLEGSLGDAESPLEEEVLDSLRSMGHDAVPQVGVAGYRIDIGVRHPTKPGSYLLGVECDGASYHSSKVARDRDRLRQEVLEGLGWTIHRIWSTSWFADRSHEERRLAEVIDLTLREQTVSRRHRLQTLHGQTVSPPEADSLPDNSGRGPRPSSLKDAQGTVRPDLPSVNVVNVDFEARPEWARDYEEPEAPAGPAARDDFHDPHSRHLLVKQIRHIVHRHAPVHRDAVLRAIRKEWRLGRSGQRMRQAFDRAVTSACSPGSIESRGDWLYSPQRHTVVRVPASEDAPRRAVAEVPLEEIQMALQLTLEDAGPSSAADLCQAWARLYGWRRVGPDIQSIFERAVEAMRASGKIEGSSDRLRLKD